MSIHKVTNLFVGNGTALPANNSQVTSVSRLGIYGSDMLALNPAGGDTISTAGGSSIRFFQLLADGTYKKSMGISGQNVTRATAIHYKPARRCVAYIGYHRAFCNNLDAGVARTFTAAGGSITVANSTDYNYAIHFTNDKTFYSERPEIARLVFTSAAAATQSNIADQIVAGINGSAWGSQVSGIKEIIAIKIGDGTGAYGLTGATNYGVEITGLDINQFTNSTYKENRVNFTVSVDDSTGFGSGTTAGLIQTASWGEGTYNWVSNMENYLAQYEGISNRRLWPAQTVTLTSSSTPVLSGTVTGAATTPTGNVTATSGSDLVTVATSTAALRPGELIDINGTNYEIKYIISTTTFALTIAATASYGPAANLKVRYLYNVIVLGFTDTSFTTGAEVSTLANKVVVIATPAIDAGAADPFDSTGDSADTSAEALDLTDILNSWLASTPLAPTTLAYTFNP